MITLAPAIPDSESALTPDWCSAVLGRSVTQVTVARIGEEEGFTGARLYRLSTDQGAWVVKLSPTDATRRATYARANAREVQFYTERAWGVDVPRCAYGRADPETGRSVLVLEDLSHLRRVRFVDGVGFDDAKAGLSALAQLHASWWARPEIETLSGSEIFREFPFDAYWADYPAAVSELLPDLPLPRSVRALGDHCAAHQDRIGAALLDQGPCTALHRDAQADNLLFGSDGRTVLLDWQMEGRGRAAFDVSYFLISSLPPRLRRAHERALLTHYLGCLRARGIESYGLRELQRDTLRSVVAKLWATVLSTVALDNGTAAKRAWRREDLRRLIAFCDDHGLGPGLFRT